MIISVNSTLNPSNIHKENFVFLTKGYEAFDDASLAMVKIIK